MIYQLLLVATSVAFSACQKKITNSRTQQERPVENGLASTQNQIEDSQQEVGAVLSLTDAQRLFGQRARLDVDGLKKGEIAVLRIPAPRKSASLTETIPVFGLLCAEEQGCNFGDISVKSTEIQLPAMGGSAVAINRDIRILAPAGQSAVNYADPNPGAKTRMAVLASGKTFGFLERSAWDLTDEPDTKQMMTQIANGSTLDVVLNSQALPEAMKARAIDKQREGTINNIGPEGGKMLPVDGRTIFVTAAASDKVYGEVNKLIDSASGLGAAAGLNIDTHIVIVVPEGNVEGAKKSLTGTAKSLGLGELDTKDPTITVTTPTEAGQKISSLEGGLLSPTSVNSTFSSLSSSPTQTAAALNAGIPDGTATGSTAPKVPSGNDIVLGTSDPIPLPPKVPDSTTGVTPDTQNLLTTEIPVIPGNCGATAIAVMHIEAVSKSGVITYDFGSLSGIVATGQSIIDSVTKQGTHTAEIVIKGDPESLKTEAGGTLPLTDVIVDGRAVQRNGKTLQQACETCLKNSAYYLAVVKADNFHEVDGAIKGPGVASLQFVNATYLGTIYNLITYPDSFGAASFRSFVDVPVMKQVPISLPSGEGELAAVIVAVNLDDDEGQSQEGAFVGFSPIISAADKTAHLATFETSSKKKAYILPGVYPLTKKLMGYAGSPGEVPARSQVNNQRNPNPTADFPWVEFIANPPFLGKLKPDTHAGLVDSSMTPLSYVTPLSEVTPAGFAGDWNVVAADNDAVRVSPSQVQCKPEGLNTVVQAVREAKRIEGSDSDCRAVVLSTKNCSTSGDSHQFSLHQGVGPLVACATTVTQPQEIKPTEKPETGTTEEQPIAPTYGLSVTNDSPNTTADATKADATTANTVTSGTSQPTSQEPSSNSPSSIITGNDPAPDAPAPREVQGVAGAGSALNGAPDGSLTGPDTGTPQIGVPGSPLTGAPVAQAAPPKGDAAAPPDADKVDGAKPNGAIDAGAAIVGGILNGVEASAVSPDGATVTESGVTSVAGNTPQPATTGETSLLQTVINVFNDVVSYFTTTSTPAPTPSSAVAP